MAYLNETISLNELPEDTGGDFSPIPAGDYTATIKSAELKATSKGDGQMIKLRLDVTGPTHAGRVIFTNLNIRNASPDAERIGRAQLRSIMLAAGLTELQDSDQLIGANLGIKVAIREARKDAATGKTYDASNEVKAYKAIDGGAPMMASKPSFAQAPAAAPAKAAPPWAKK